MKQSRGSTPAPTRAPDPLQAWRGKALYLLLAVLAVGGLFAYGSTIADALVRGQMTPLLWVYAGVYVSFLLVAVLPRLGVPLRAWLVFILAYANAAASFARVGLAGSSRLYLVFIPATAVILIGTRAGWTCLAISLGMFVGFGFLAGQGILGRWLTVTENPVTAGFWIEAGATLAVFLVMLTMLIGRFFARHLHTLETSRAMTGELERASAALQRRVEERTRELGLLNSVAAVVSGLVDIREILGISLRKTMESFDMEAGSAYELEETTATLVMLAHAGLPRGSVESLERLPLETALAGKALSIEQPLTWTVDEYPVGVLRDFMEAEGLRRVIGAPLVAKGRLVGGFVLNSRREHALSAEEQSLLIAIGQQVGLALENARLLDSERAGKTEANRRREVAEGLRETLAVLNSHRPLQQILDFIVGQACHIMGSDAAALMQMEPPDGLFSIRASCSLDAAYAARVRYGARVGSPGRAVETRQAVAIPDLAAYEERLSRDPGGADPEEMRNIAYLLSQGFRAVLTTPLVVLQEAFGAICLYYRAPREFNAEEVQLATSLADQASLALENARLHQEAEQAAALEERNRLARELHDSVTQSLYSVTLYAEAASRVLAAGQAAEAAGHLRDLGTTAREALREMRLLIFELNPPALEKGSLADALQIRLDAVEVRGGVSVSFKVEGTECLLPQVRQDMYQVAQEALNNTLKHAHAQAVRVLLRFDARGAALEISDDGVGFDPDTARRGGGLGLRGMRERVEKFGGSLDIEARPGGGARIRVTAPPPPPALAGCAAPA